MVYVREARALRIRAAMAGMVRDNELASRLGEKPSTVSQTINGKQPIGRPQRLRKWCDVLGLAQDDLADLFEIRLN